MNLGASVNVLFFHLYLRNKQHVLISPAILI